MTGHVPRARSFRSWRTLRWVLAAALVPAALWACNSHPLEKPDPAPEQQTDLLYEVNPKRQLDLLFVVDNSSSMEQEQENLKNNFPNFMAELERIPGGLPDTRIAVISTDFGAGPTQPSGECDPIGDRGKFQVLNGCGLNAERDGFFLKTKDENSGMPNFQGELRNVFSCMASLGTGGCGYEHQLQAIRAALTDSLPGQKEPINLQNRGFVRDDAYLGIVILSDEDDCSGDLDSDIYKDPVEGQAGSLRCALLGHLCNGQDVPPMLNFSAPLSSCQPYVRDAAERKSRLINVQEFVDYVKQFKPGRPDKILVSSVIGWDDRADARYGIVSRPASSGSGTELDLQPACSTQRTGNAAPGIRLRSFTQAFENNTVHSICQENLAQAMTDIGKKLASILANTCVTAPMIDTDLAQAGLQADCQVTDRLQDTSDRTKFTDTILPHCRNGSMPCWDLEADMTCGSGFKTVVRRSSQAEPGTLQSIRCLTCAGAPATDPRCWRNPQP